MLKPRVVTNLISIYNPVIHIFLDDRTKTIEDFEFIEKIKINQSSKTPGSPNLENLKNSGQQISPEKVIHLLAEKLKKKLNFFSALSPIIFPFLELNSFNNFINVSINEESWISGNGLSLHFPEISVRGNSYNASEDPLSLMNLFLIVYENFIRKLFKKTPEPTPKSDSENILNSDIDESVSGYDSSSSGDQSLDEPTIYINENFGLHTKKTDDMIAYTHYFSIAASNFQVLTSSKASSTEKNEESTSSLLKYISGLGFSLNSKSRESSITELVRMEILGKLELVLKFQSAIWGELKNAKIGLYCDPVSLSSDGISAIISEVNKFSLSKDSKSGVLYTPDLKSNPEGFTQSIDINNNFSKDYSPESIEKKLNEFKIFATEKIEELFESLRMKKSKEKKYSTQFYKIAYILKLSQISFVQLEASIKRIYFEMPAGLININDQIYEKLLIKQKDIRFNFSYIINPLDNSDIPKKFTFSSEDTIKHASKMPSAQSRPKSAENIENSQLGDALPDLTFNKHIFDSDNGDPVLSPHTSDNIGFSQTKVDEKESIVFEDFSVKDFKLNTTIKIIVKAGSFNVKLYKASNSSNKKIVGAEESYPNVSISSISLFYEIPINFIADKSLKIYSFPKMVFKIENPNAKINLKFILVIEKAIKSFSGLNTASKYNSDKIVHQDKPGCFTQATKILISDKYSLLSKRKYIEIWELHKERVVKCFNIAELFELFLKKLEFESTVTNFKIELYTSLSSDLKKIEFETKNIVLYFKKAEIRSSLADVTPSSENEKLASIKNKIYTKMSCSPFLVYFKNNSINEEPKNIKNNQIQYILGNNGVSADLEIDLFLGYTSKYFREKLPYIKSKVNVELGVFSVFLGGDNLINLFYWVPVWSLAIRLLRKISPIIYESHNIQKEKTDFNTDEASLCDKSDLINNYSKILASDFISSFSVIKKTSVNISLKEFRISLSTFDGNIDKSINLLHGLSLFVRNVDLKIKLDVNKFSKKIENNLLIGQISAITFSSVKGDIAETPLLNLTFNEYFKALGWLIKDKENLIIFNSIKISSSFINEFLYSSPALNTMSKIKSADVSISSASFYRVFLLLHQFGILQAAMNFKSESPKKAIKRLPKTVSTLDILIDRVYIKISFPKADVHDCFTKYLIEASDITEDIDLLLDIPELRICSKSNELNTDKSLNLKLDTPNVGILDYNKAKNPLATFTKFSVVIQKPKIIKTSKPTPNSSLPKKGIDLDVTIKFDSGSLSIPHNYTFSYVIDSFSVFLKLFKTLKKMKKKSILKYTSEIELEFGDINTQATSEKSIDSVIEKLFSMYSIPIPSFRSDLVFFSKGQVPLSEPDYIPRIHIIAKSFSFFLMDDPFEIALSRIYHVGKLEQVQRLSRLEAFEKKISKKNSFQSQNLEPSLKSQTSNVDTKDSASVSSKPGKKSLLEKSVSNDYLNSFHMKPFGSESNSKNKSINSMNKLKANNNTNNENLKSQFYTKKFKSLKKIPSAENVSILSSSSAPIYKNDGKEESIISKSPLEHSNGDYLDTKNLKNTSISDSNANNFTYSTNHRKKDNNDLNSDTKSLLYEFESRLWVKTIRELMIENTDFSENDESDNDIVKNPYNSKKKSIISTPTRQGSSMLNKEKSYDPELPSKSNSGTFSNYPISQLEFLDNLKFFHTQNDRSSISLNKNKKPLSTSGPPYQFKHGKLRYPNVPLLVFSMFPVRIMIRTPNELLDFEQIENYMREIDPSTPVNQNWSTLVPINLRLKAGELRVQLRDYPSPLLFFPDPYKSNDKNDINIRHKLGYKNFRGGVSIEGGFIISEQQAHMGALRLLSIPIYSTPQINYLFNDKDMKINTGQLTSSNEFIIRVPIVKSLTFPRVHTNFSVIIFTAATTQAEKALKYYHSNNLDGLDSLGISYNKILKIVRLNRLPAQSPIVCWYQRVQPVLSEISQRIESLTSSSSEPSPHLGWWDKIRSRFITRFRLACIDVKLSDLAIKDTPKNLNSKRFDHSLYLSLQSEQSGEFLLYLLGGRDPYSFSIKNSGYLISLQGDVRISIGEGDYYDTGKNKIFSKEYVIDLGDYGRDSTGTSPGLNEVVVLRSKKFLTCVPEINNSSIDTLKLMKRHLYDNFNISYIEKYRKILSSDILDLVILSMTSSEFTFLKLGSLASDCNLYKKPLASFSRGVRLSIGFSTSIKKASFEKNAFVNSTTMDEKTHNRSSEPQYIPNNVINSHWDIRPHALENIPNYYKKNYDAYNGFRSLGVHFGLSILCPYELGESSTPSGSSTPNSADLDGFETKKNNRLSINRMSRSSTKKAKKNSTYNLNITVPNIIVTDNSVSNPEINFSGNDALGSPLIDRKSSLFFKRNSYKSISKQNFIGNDSTFDSVVNNDNSISDISDSELSNYSYSNKNSKNFSINAKIASPPLSIAGDTVFSECNSVLCSISPLHRCNLEKTSIGDDYFMCGFNSDPHSLMADENNTSHSSNDRAKVFSSMISTDMFLKMLSLFSAKLMLPVRKGKLYPFNESKDIKFGKSLLSFRVGLNLTDFQLSYTQHTSEIKELESQELNDLLTSYGLNSGAVQTLLRAFKQQTTGFDSFASNDEKKPQLEHTSPTKAEGNVYQLKGRTKLIHANLLMVQKRQKLFLNKKNSRLNEISESDSSYKNIRVEAKTKKKNDEVSLTWSIQDSDAEIDDFDVRIVKMDYKLPLFLNCIPSRSGINNGQWKFSTYNGMHIFPESLEYLKLSPEKLDWIDSDSLFDLGTFDLSNAIFSNVDVLCFLWAPRMVYFIQTAIEESLIPIDLDHSSLMKKSSVVSIDKNDGILGEGYYVKLSSSRPNVPLEPEEYNQLYLNRKLNTNDLESDALVELRARAGLIDTGILSDDSALNMTSLIHNSIRNSISNRLHNTGTRRSFSKRPTISQGQSKRNSKQYSEKVQSLYLSDSDSDNGSLRDQNFENFENFSTGVLDYKKILRDPRLTQSLLLSRRKERLGYAIKHYEIKNKINMDDFEQGLYTSSIDYHYETIKIANEIFELSARRRLINKCLDMLGYNSNNPKDFSSSSFRNSIVSSNKSVNASDGESLQGLESLFRHRFLLHSAYLVWNSKVRDILFRFFYNEDDWIALKYFLSQSASQVVSELDKKYKNAEYSPSNRNSTNDCSNSINETRSNINSSTDPRNNFSYESIYDTNSEDLSQNDTSKPTKDPIKSNSDDNNYFKQVLNKDSLSGSFDNSETINLMKDFQNFTPSYSALIEFLNSQVSLSIDENSSDSMVATAEKAQLHIIQLLSEDTTKSIPMLMSDTDTRPNSSGDSIISPSDSILNNSEVIDFPDSSPTNDFDEIDLGNKPESNTSLEKSLVKTRMLFEIKNMQLFYLKRQDFVDCPLYLMDCFYGAHVDNNSLSSTLWPAWIPIEILLTPESIDDSTLVHNYDNGDDRKHREVARINLNGLNSETKNKSTPRYSKILDRTSGMVIFDRMNTHRIQSEDIENNDKINKINSFKINGSKSNKKDSFHYSANIPSNNYKHDSENSERNNSNKFFSSSLLDEIINESKNTGISNSPENAEKSKRTENEQKNTDNDESNASLVIIRMPQINVSLTSEQFSSALSIITDLLIYNEPERSLYLENLSLIKLTTDLSSISDIGPMINRIQQSLRIRKHMFQIWCQKQWKSSKNPDLYMISSELDLTDCSASGKPHSILLKETPSLSEISAQDIRTSANYGSIILALTRQIKVLEQQLKVVMDLVSAAKKKLHASKKAKNIKNTRLDDSEIYNYNNKNDLVLNSSRSFSSKIKISSGKNKNEESISKSGFKSHSDLSSAATESIKKTKNTPSSRSILDNVSSWRKKSKKRPDQPDTTSPERFDEHGKEELIQNKSVSNQNNNSQKPISKDTRSISHNSVNKVNNIAKLDYSKRHSIAMYIGIHISSVNWRILDNENKPICDIKLRNLGVSLITSTSLANDIFINADLIIMLNRIENSIYPEILMPYSSNRNEFIDFSKEKMLKINYSELPPVGGIRIVELLEIDLSPIRIQLSKDITKLLINYFFTSSDDNNSEIDLTKAGAPSSANISSLRDNKLSINNNNSNDSSSILLAPRTESSKASSKLNTKSPSQLSNSVSRKPTQQILLPAGFNNNENIQQKTMQTKASQNKTFILVRILGHKHIISFHGSKKKNLLDINNFVFKAPTLEYHNEVFTYYQLLMQMKKAFISAAFHHTGALFKEKVKQLQGSKSQNKAYDDAFTKKLVKQIDESDSISKHLSFFGYQGSGANIKSKSIKSEKEKKISQTLFNTIPTSLFTPISNYTTFKKPKIQISNNLKKNSNKSSSSRELLNGNSNVDTKDSIDSISDDLKEAELVAENGGNKIPNITINSNIIENNKSIDTNNSDFVDQSVESKSSVPTIDLDEFTASLTEDNHQSENSQFGFTQRERFTEPPNGSEKNNTQSSDLELTFRSKLYNRLTKSKSNTKTEPQ
ncbi:UPF0648 protein [Smittium culicis]|uniref:UPF0648 protein n=1 Tax=Smittium culicis TaxID=133412 RepID=A0A1R1XLF3_9FUNG|nr:UPF0648 protein [Smittium culicis]